MKTRCLRIGSVALAFAALALIITSCGVGERITGSLLIRINDNVLAARSIMPPVSLVGDHYAVHGVGTSGAALGATFDLDIDAAVGTAAVDLLPGGWTLTAVVWNDDTPSVAVGDGANSLTIVVGTPATITLTCLPYDGDGDLVIDLDWVPDIIAAPSVEAEVRTFAGVTTPIAMPLASSTAANGTATLAQGWYIGAVRISDAGVLNAGIVKTVRVAADVTTTWTEFLTVSQLEGGLTIDGEWFPGLPLVLSATPATGDFTLYGGDDYTFTITGADNDPATTLVYAWYLDGVLTAVSTAASYTILDGAFDIGSYHYLSAVVWQSDGERAADAQWKLATAAELPASAYNIDFSVTTVSGGSNIVYHLTPVGGGTVLDYAGGLGGNETLKTLAVTGVPVGEYTASCTYQGNTNYWTDTGVSMYPDNLVEFAFPNPGAAYSVYFGSM